MRAIPFNLTNTNSTPKLRLGETHASNYDLTADQNPLYSNRSQPQLQSHCLVCFWPESRNKKLNQSEPEQKAWALEKVEALTEREQRGLMMGFKRRWRRQSFGLVLVGTRKSREREGLEEETMKEAEWMEGPWELQSFGVQLLNWTCWTLKINFNKSWS